jgi:uncharacterized protein YggE
MENKNDFVMYLIVLFAVIIFSALILFSFATTFSSKVQGSQVNGTQLNTVTVTASGSASAKSSEAELYMTVNGTGPTSGIAVQNLSETLSRFNSTILPFINGNLSQISTTYYNVNKVYNGSYYPPICNCPEIPANTTVVISQGPCYCPVAKGYSTNSTNPKYANYVATEELTLTIPNINNVSAVLGATAAIPNIYVTSTGSMLNQSQISTLRTQALTLALSNATSQADALIGGGNKIYSTNITVDNYYTYPYLYSAGVAEGGSGANSTISPQYYGGTNKVTEEISVTFNYGPK